MGRVEALHDEGAPSRAVVELGVWTGGGPVGWTTQTEDMRHADKKRSPDRVAEMLKSVRPWKRAVHESTCRQADMQLPKSKVHKSPKLSTHS
jgi:hypothetical protein